MSSELDPRDQLCFRAETAKLLALNVAQIHSGMHEGESSIEQLGDSFQDLAKFCMQVQTNPDSDEDTKQLAANVLAKVDKAIVSFQFYDRLSQRLNHVQNNLSLLAELVSDNQKLESSEDWRLLRDKISASYTIETEKEMHDAILNGASIEEALSLFKQRLKDSDGEQVVELF